MKAIILVGGLGTRISEETSDKPKPLVRIGGKPILWHIMKIYQSQGVNEFLLAAGYKYEVVLEYVSELQKTDKTLHIEVLDTGLHTATGGRLKRSIAHLGEKRVFATYGDGVANIDIRALLKFHQSKGATATLTAVRPPARFGRVEIGNGLVTHFGEKNQSDEGWINGGFFVLENQVAHLISGDDMPFEHEPLVKLSKDAKLAAYQHEGFWQPMDTLREKNDLEELWKTGNAPWKMWN